MSNKQTEALKLALAGLVKASRYGFGEFEEEKSAISSAIQHLEMAEQPAQQEPVAWATREDFYRELGRSVERAREEMKVKSVTMRCKDYDLALPIIDAHFGHVLVGQISTPPASKPWVGLTDEDTYEATGTASTDLLALAKLWSDNKIHVYQFDNEARKIIEAVLRRASAKLREKNTGETK